MVIAWPSTTGHRCQFVIVAFIIALALAHIGSNWSSTRNSSHVATADTAAHMSSDSSGSKCEGQSRKLPSIQHRFPDTMPAKWTEKMEQRRADIKQSFLHAWHGYSELHRFYIHQITSDHALYIEKYAMGQDELRPVSNTYINNFGGWGATLIDSLTTLRIMDLEAEFNDALSHLPQNFHTQDERLSVFETTIRHLAGLLSAYELSGHQHKVLLRKAEALGQVLLPAFDNPAGYPSHFWDQSRYMNVYHMHMCVVLIISGRYLLMRKLSLLKWGLYN